MQVARSACMMCDVASGSGDVSKLNVEAQLAHLLSSLSTLHFQPPTTSIWYISTPSLSSYSDFDYQRKEDEDGWDRLKRGLGASVEQQKEQDGCSWRRIHA